MKEYYLDYREQVRNILDALDDSSTSLRLGAVAIENLLTLARVDLDDEDEEAETGAEEDEGEEDSDDSDAIEEADSGGDLADAETEDKKQVKIIRHEELTASIHYQLCRFSRALKGGSFYTEQGDLVSEINELAVRNLNVENGDLVELDPSSQPPRVVRIVEAGNLPSNIATMSYGVVERDPAGDLYVSRSAMGESLSECAGIDRYEVPAIIDARQTETGFVHEGDIVDLAWYKNSPSNMIVRWVSQTKGEEAPKKEKPAEKKVKSEKEDKDKEESVTTLNFDLHGRSVAVVIGNELRSQEIQKMVGEHHGRCKVIDAFKFSDTESFYKHALKRADVTVMVQNLNKHSTSKALRKYAKRLAIADSAGLSSIERAIYRAMHGLPAYETSTQPIAYPVKELALS
ncbi:DUF2325 domain-containing protein [Lactobacillus delbrueckii subsp. lactis]|jgi:hypothetical protein|uniref:DUF2325 domain-containing protein n=1 Tax=Lactobacillus delbrueckii TaxID=1584 RepID=UPI0001EC31F3|nr:DUF2325 domain-containing protein [Lactobacillus delbrueckii]ADQ60993.1 Hypothetical protein LDBND_0950 [Lactobacillus delbrueckii subsp. bulgaricus ND02]MBO3082920.1 DUF2325 domain-containing protein [Lactobacillus delbrueckii subsp. bulgaricus]MCD5439183.1 DUF2325 domain-containing protein [Lactobacillus delbrueckii subsp. lactis]MCD5469313.1 DUF2325 domain-containing protein [Lactobacillus delbrueckii subsp. lactis]MCZ0796972.1 DUF2325 domain-containing protein [Lactobacillus delbrueckii